MLKILSQDKRNRNLIKVERKDIGESWGYRIWINNKRIIRTGFKTRADAENALSKRRLAKLYDEHGITLEHPHVKLSKLIERWVKSLEENRAKSSRIKVARRVGKTFLAWLGDKRLDRITENDLVAYREYRGNHSQGNQGRKAIGAGTLNNEMGKLAACFNSAARLFPKLRWQPPKIDRLPQKFRRTRILKPKEIQALLTTLRAQANRNHKAGRENAALAITIALETAMRIGEICSMTDDWLHWSDCTIRFITPKTGAQRIIPMTPTVAAILRKGIPAFAHPHTVRKTIQNAAIRAGLTYGSRSLNGFVFHDLRHTAVTGMINAGVPFPAIQAATGHSSTEMMLRYGHLTKGSLEQIRSALVSVSVTDEVGIRETPENPERPKSSLTA